MSRTAESADADAVVGLLDLSPAYQCHASADLSLRLAVGRPDRREPGRHMTLFREQRFIYEFPPCVRKTNQLVADDRHSTKFHDAILQSSAALSGKTRI